MNAARRHVLVTGAAGGIGRALVESFATAGYHVVASDRTDRPAWLPTNAAYVGIELARMVRDAAYATGCFKELRAALGDGSLHGLVNNAAVQILAPTEQLGFEDWQTTLDVNLSAPFLLTKNFLPELERVQGAVVNISSIHAALTKQRFVAYATSKAALSGMTRAMAVDLGDRIRVNAIEPAAIHTEMLADGFRGNPEGLARLAQYHPVNDIGAAQEVARLAVLLCDGALPFANGACINLDGGIRARLHDPD